MMWSLGFDPVVPAWLIALLAVAAAGLLALAVARGLRGTWLRAIAVAALVAALVNPIIVREERDPLSTVVAVVVDRSASQELAARDETTEAMRAALVARLGQLEGIEIRTIDGARDRAASDGTELFAALNAGLADVPPDRLGAVIMLTDGQVHDVPAGPLDLGGAPVHALVSGRTTETDRRVVVDDAPLFGIVGEPQTVTYTVMDDGAAPGATVRVSILADGRPFRTDTVIAGRPSTFTFEVPHGGDNVLEFQAEELPGELTDLNNRAIVEINGIRENLRVLLVSGEPHVGERTWRDLLKSDASVDLIHFTILRPPEKQDGTPVNELALIQFPTRELFEQRINEFDLIIFDRYQEQGVLPPAYFENMAQFVRNGGAILIAAGPDDVGFFSIYNTALATILPISPTGDLVEAPFYPRVTEAGFRHPVTRELLGAAQEPPAWSRWFRQVVATNPTGDVVMNGADGRPLLVLAHEGEGRVAMLLSDQAWLWARGFEGGGPHIDLLRNLAHWLMKEPDLEEEALRAAADNGQITIERQTMEEAVAPVTVTSPSGATTTLALEEVEPGLYRGTLPADEVGLWQVTDGTLVAVTHVGPPNPREFQEALSTTAKLEPVVDATNGHIGRMLDAGGNLDLPRVLEIRPGAANYGGGDWLGIRMTEASTLLGIARVPLFLGFLGLAILLGLVTLAWYREGR
ncbi:MAG: hypothetical protein IT534_02965 [Bauldia sp.]|nr:hypothetical protein [Bauldia sp.]